MSDVDQVARDRIDDLKLTVQQHRSESQLAHAATGGKLDQQTGKIDAQSIILARMEERAIAEEKARKEREDQAWSPTKIAVVMGSIGSLLAALGYGAPKAIEAATAHEPVKVTAPPSEP